MSTFELLMRAQRSHGWLRRRLATGRIPKPSRRVGIAFLWTETEAAAVLQLAAAEGSHPDNSSGWARP